MALKKKYPFNLTCFVCESNTQTNFEFIRALPSINKQMTHPPESHFQILKVAHQKEIMDQNNRNINNEKCEIIQNSFQDILT